MEYLTKAVGICGLTFAIFYVAANFFSYEIAGIIGLVSIFILAAKVNL